MHAHTEVYETLKKRTGGADARIGIVKNIFQIDPYRRWSPLDWWLARAGERLMNERILQYFERGVFELQLSPLVSVRYENAAGPKSLDVVGLNYYSHLTLSAEPWSKARARVRLRPSEVPTDMIFAAYPEGLYRALTSIRRLGVPIYVTENGIADAKDDRRADWIRRYLFAMARAIEEGVDVRGYFYWSLLDNFEWIEGFDQKFGLYEIDFETQTRRLREGAEVFREIVSRR
jgi:beta-glucosidase